MATDNYNPETSRTLYNPSVSNQIARLWAREKTLHDLADFGAVEFFEGGGTNPTALAGYATSKLWLKVDDGVTAECGTVRYYAGGDATLLASWPELDREGFSAHIGARSGAEFDFVWSSATSGDPGLGKARADNATLSSLTSIAVSETGRQSQTYATRIGGWLAGDKLRIYTLGDESKYAEVTLSANPVDAGSYRTMNVTVVSATSIDNGALVGIAHIPVDSSVSDAVAQTASNAALAGTYATAAAASATAASGSAASALAAANGAIAAAALFGPYLIYDTRAAADAALAGLPANQNIMVYADETRGGVRTYYRKEGGVYVYKAADDKIVVGSRAALAALNPAYSPVVYFSDPIEGGEFVWDGANLSAAVTADTLQGVFIAPASAPTGASGAWRRSYAGAVRAEWFGCRADNATLNAAKANVALATLDAMGGGSLLFDVAGTYLLENTGVHPVASGRRRCIHILGSNIAVKISTGVTLKLANGQQTSSGGTAGPVEILTWNNASSNIEISGGGTIQGNTAGQSGWTGGYTQNASGNLLASWGSASGGAGQNWVIKDLVIEDHFSNTINIGLGLPQLPRGDAGNRRPRNVTVQNVLGRNCGEGIQLISCDYVLFTGNRYRDDADVNVGDAMELASCEHFVASDLHVYGVNGGGGGALDITSCRNGTVKGLVIYGWSTGMDFSTTTYGVTDNIVVDGVQAIAMTGGSNIFSYSCEGRIKFSNIAVYDCPNHYVFDLVATGSDDTRPPYVLDGFHIDNGLGFRVQSARPLRVSNGTVRNCPILFNFLTGALHATPKTYNVKAENIQNEGTSTFQFQTASTTVVGKLKNIECAAPTWPFGTTNFNECEFVDVGPAAALDNSTGQQGRLANLRRLLRTTTTNITALGQGSKGQRIEIIARASFTVRDISTTGVDIHLAGSADFNMTDGASLLLEYRTSTSVPAEAGTTGWFEISRTVV